MKLHILGCHAATPRTMANPTAQVLEAGGQLFLIDCGEATQVQLRKYSIKFSRITHIFISHLHGDHFFGLPGLVSTFRLLGRDTPLHIHGPKGIKEAITLMLKLGDSWTNYPLHFHELSSKESELIYEDEKISVHTVPLKHRVYTNGFVFREKLGLRKLNVEAAKAHAVPQYYFQNIKLGKDVVLEDGTHIPNNVVSLDPPPPKSYAYCSDTAYDEAIIPHIAGATLLYHESTFLEAQQALAQKTKHSTAMEAARIAKAAGVGQLLLGHFSTRYKNSRVFQEEAATIFEPVTLAEDGKRIEF